MLDRDLHNIGPDGLSADGGALTDTLMDCTGYGGHDVSCPLGRRAGVGGGRGGEGVQLGSRTDTWGGGEAGSRPAGASLLSLPNLTFMS